MNVSEALRSRRSVRYFGKQEVPEETLRSIVDDAIHAPSWCDAQPWKVYIATGSRALEIRENHRGIAEPGLKGHSDLAAGHREDWGERACANMARLGSEVMGFLGDDGNQIADFYRDLLILTSLIGKTKQIEIADRSELTRKTELVDVIGVGAGSHAKYNILQIQVRSQTSGCTDADDRLNAVKMVEFMGINTNRGDTHTRCHDRDLLSFIGPGKTKAVADLVKADDIC